MDKPIKKIKPSNPTYQSKVVNHIKAHTPTKPITPPNTRLLTQLNQFNQPNQSKRTSHGLITKAAPKPK